MDNVHEEWRPVVGYEEHYAVSNKGRVKRTRMNRGVRNFGQPMNLRLNKAGYPIVPLSVGSRKNLMTVHRLVAAAFLGPTERRMQVNHIDSNKTNNHVSNLEYVTPGENIRHSVAMGTHASGERHPNAKLRDAQANEILTLQHKEASTAIAARYGISPSTVCRIWNKGVRRGAQNASEKPPSSDWK